jgi:hypothetical protein
VNPRALFCSNAVQFGDLPAFRRNTSVPSSRSPSNPSAKGAETGGKHINILSWLTL